MGDVPGHADHGDTLALTLPNLRHGCKPLLIFLSNLHACFFWTSWNHPPTRIAASGYKRKHHDTVGSSAAGRPSRVINILQVLFLIIIRLPFVDLSEAVTSWMRKKTEFPKETSQQALRVRNHARVSMLEPGDFEMCLGLVVALQPCKPHFLLFDSMDLGWSSVSHFWGRSTRYHSDTALLSTYGFVWRWGRKK